MRNLGELSGSGGFTAAVVEENKSTMTNHIRVLPPKWDVNLSISQLAMSDDLYLEATLDYAVRALVEEILKNPMIAERVKEMLADHYHEGLEQGWEEMRA